MGRTLRIHQPGAAFHIVTRTQGQFPLFDERCRDAVADTLLTGIVSAGAKPIAFAVMPNHLHVIMVQGSASLGWTMQPILQRIALLMQRRHKVEGHVFERRFRAKCCQDAEYLPNAIVYVHRNPVEAGLSDSPCNYRWSSASCYEGTAPPGFVAIEDGLNAFDPTGLGGLEERRVAYSDRMKSRELDRNGLDYWQWYFAPHRRRTDAPFVPSSRHSFRGSHKDVRDAAIEILFSIDPKAELELVRSRYGGPKVVDVRKQLIAALIQRDYAGVRIAKYLRISEATVSKVRSSMRWGSVPDTQTGQY